MSHKPVVPLPDERALPGRSFRLRGPAGGGTVLRGVLCRAGRPPGLAAAGRRGLVRPAGAGPAAAGHGGARRPGPDLQRRRRAVGHERHLLDHPRLPPRDAGGKAGHSRPGPGRHPRAGRGRPAGKVRPAALQRLPAALPGGPGDGRGRPGLLRPERDHRHPHQPGHPPAIPGRGVPGVGAGLYQCGQRRGRRAGTGIQRYPHRPERPGADGGERLGLHDGAQLRRPSSRPSRAAAWC